MFNFSKKQDKEPENIDEVLARFKKLEAKFDKVSKELEELKQENIFMIQKINILRYNPFKEVGGNQSFSVVMLDGNNTGIMLTSLYSREGNRVYSKSIKEGQSEHILSKEEKTLLEQTINNQSGNQLEQNGKDAK